MERRDARAWAKPILVEAVRNVQPLCPPRPSRQSKAELTRIVRSALALPGDHPIRSAMQRALDDARSHAEAAIDGARA